jgi:hypothetical protein
VRPLSDFQFEMLGIIGIVAIVVGWGARDLYLLRRYARDKNATGDQIFGSIMGVIMVTLGAIGLALHLMDR